MYRIGINMYEKKIVRQVDYLQELIRTCSVVYSLKPTVYIHALKQNMCCTLLSIRVLFSKHFPIILLFAAQKGERPVRVLCATCLAFSWQPLL